MLEYLRYKGACHDSQTDLLDAPLVYNWPNVRMHTKRFTAEITTNRCKMWGNIITRLAQQFCMYHTTTNANANDIIDIKILCSSVHEQCSVLPLLLRICIINKRKNDTGAAEVRTKYCL